MRTIRQSIKAVLLVGGAVVIACGNPLVAFADDTPATATAPVTTTTTPVTDSTATTPGPSPTSSTSPNTSSSPATEPVASSTPAPTAASSTSTPPKTTYTYDGTTGHWNSSSWTYNPLSGTYQPTVIPVVTPPAPDKTSTSSPTGGATDGGNTIDTATTTAIANALNQTATSGNASVLHNTTAGSATSGDASSAATIINNVNSSLTNSSNNQAASFVTNVMGNVNGDILLQPMLLKAMLEAGAQPSAATTVSQAANTGITNNVTLGATSGNATVSGNTNAGNATTGSANTVADVVNIVNSMIAANQSFVGTINIYGNLNGDILIAPDFIPQLLASNANSTSSAPVGTASITSNDTQSIVNNIALAAKTGQSLVTNNTNAGNATTGSASTNAVIFNLTGHDIVASNSLLVFVNVLGTWVGVIVDAPTGATAAALGNGVTTNSVAPNLVINTTNSTQLTNNINLVSQSGNATVSNNTNAGNATTGNATASTSIANISNTTIGTSGWFGILFINVFGSWLGSFGINTAAGDPIVTQTVTASSGGGANPPHVMEFIPHAPRKVPVTVVQGDTTSSIGTSEGSDSDSAVLGWDTSSTNTPDSTKPSKISKAATPTESFNVLLLIGSLILVGGLVVGLRRIL